MNKQFNNQQGLGLMEVLVAAVIMAVGLLALGSFHSSLIAESQGNKARVEAIALAQARIEQLRNYTNDAGTEAEFDTLFADTNGYDNDVALTGVAAVFNRDESFDPVGSMKQVSVRVAWTDSKNVAQQVVLSTELGYEPPRGGADLTAELEENLLPSVQGRAKLGDGQLPTGAPTTLQDDGTELYIAGDDDLRLVLDGDIVLTLINACISSTCTDFAKIHGRVYIDTANTSTIPGDLFIAASDAAFCQRYYTDSNGDVQTVVAGTSSTVTTSAGDYEYFDYNCYVGGGWRGNIGLVLAGGIAQTHKVCVGDPVSSNGWNEPVIVARRAYRGMLYKHDDDTDSGREEYIDQFGSTRIRHYSYGIADAAEIPTSGSNVQHDFVFSELSPNLTNGSYCISQGILVRSDSAVNGVAGDRFSGNEDDFVCLNDGWVDSFDTGIFGVDSTCPFDPTDPPVGVYVISGAIDIEGAANDNNAVSQTTINTSDGPGNCALHSLSFDNVNDVWNGGYACNVYDWGSGWAGHINLGVESSTVECSNTTIAFSNLTTNSSGNDFACTTGNGSTGSLQPAIIAGTVTAGGNKKLTGVVISDGGSCILAADGLSYLCTTEPFESVWSVSITFTKNGGVWCTADLDSTSGIATFLDIVAGAINYNINITNSSAQCSL